MDSIKNVNGFSYKIVGLVLNLILTFKEFSKIILKKKVKPGELLLTDFNTFCEATWSKDTQTNRTELSIQK